MTWEGLEKEGRYCNSCMGAARGCTSQEGRSEGTVKSREEHETTNAREVAP